MTLAKSKIGTVTSTTQPVKAKKPKQPYVDTKKYFKNESSNNNNSEMASEPASNTEVKKTSQLT